MKKIVVFILLISTLTAGAEDLAYKIGQMLVVGFRGTSLDENTLMMLSRHNIGGVILFDKDMSNGKGVRNIIDPPKFKKLVNTIQRVAPSQIFIAVDQEGGAVARLNTDRGFDTTVSASYLGSVDCPDTTRHWAERTAVQLEEMGINLNFAPCVDLNTNPANPVIGSRGRSFGWDPDCVTRNAKIVIEEHRKHGIVTSLKHFPGHGSSQTDSHSGFTDITSTFCETELEPYRALIKEGYADIVMVGHLYNAKYDSTYPASLSKITIDSLLRGELGFNGVVATDDMHMKAITDNYEYEKALQLAINAGVDMIVIGNNGPQYQDNLITQTIAIIYRLVKENNIPAQRIDQAWQRIQNLKKQIQ